MLQMGVTDEDGTYDAHVSWQTNRRIQISPTKETDYKKQGLKIDVRTQPRKLGLHQVSPFT